MSQDERVNKLTARLAQSEQNDWLPDDVSFEDSAARERDGELREAQYALDGETNPIRARNLLRIQLAQLRTAALWPVRIGWEGSMKQRDIQPLDTITVSHAEYGWKDTEMQVVSVVHLQDWTAVALLRRYDSSIYDQTLALPGIPRRPVRFTDQAETITPTGLGVDEIAHVLPGGSVSIRLEAYWDAAEVMKSEARGRVKAAGNDPLKEWQAMAVAGNRATLEDVNKGDTYQWQVRHWRTEGINSAWTDGPERLVAGDLTPPGAIVNPSVTFLPGGFSVNGTAPEAEDTRIICVFASTQSGFTADQSTLIQSVPVSPGGIFREQFGGYESGVPIYVKSLAKDTSGNESLLTSEFMVVPRPVTFEGANFHVGEGEPDDALGEDGDIYLQRMGNIWYKFSGSWVDSGIAATTPASRSALSRFLPANPYRGPYRHSARRKAPHPTISQLVTSGSAGAGRGSTRGI